MEKNCCQTITIDKDGKEHIKDKKRYISFKDANIVAKTYMSYEGIDEWLVAYRCSICNHHHIGRNGKKLTDIEKRKFKREVDILTKKEELKRMKSFNPKIVGKIDLSKVPKEK